MKKIILTLAMLIMAISLCACSSDKKVDDKSKDNTKSEETKKDTKNEDGKSDEIQIRKIAEKIASDGDFSDDEVTEIDAEAFEQMLGIDSEKVEESVGYIGTGATTNAAYIAKFKDAAYLEEVQKAIDAYMADQIEQCESYNPPEVEKLKASAICTYPDQGIAVMVISKDSSKIKSILEEFGL